MSDYPQTYDQLRQWLIVNVLQSPPIEGEEFMVKESATYWKQIRGFRYYYYVMGIFTQKDSNLIGFHSESKEVSPEDFTSFPNMGSYSSYEELLEGVTERYSQLWNIPK